MSIGYDRTSLSDPEFRKYYKGTIETDHYGREVPKYAHGTTNLPNHTSSSKRITAATLELFDRIIDKELLVRRITIAVNNVISERILETKKVPEQLNLFMDVDASEKQKQEDAKEKHLQKAVLQIQKKYGKNALLKGTNLLDGATMRERNEQVGGHKA